MPDAISSPPLLENSMALTHPKCSFKSLEKRFFEFATRSHNIFLQLTFSDIHLSFKTLKIPLDWYLSDITVKHWMQVLWICQADIFDGTWVTSLSVSDPEIIILDRVLYIFLFFVIWLFTHYSTFYIKLSPKWNKIIWVVKLFRSSIEKINKVRVMWERETRKQ